MCHRTAVYVFGWRSDDEWSRNRFLRSGGGAWMPSFHCCHAMSCRIIVVYIVLEKNGQPECEQAYIYMHITYTTAVNSTYDTAAKWSTAPVQQQQ